MRTTLSIDDTLLRQAKSTAALQGKTLSQFVEDNLRSGLQNNDHRPPLVSHRRGKALIDLTSNAEIYRLMDEEDIEHLHAFNRRKHSD